MKRLERFGTIAGLSIFAGVGWLLIATSAIIVTDYEGILAHRYSLGTVDAWIIQGFEPLPFIAGILLIGSCAAYFVRWVNIKRVSPLAAFFLAPLLLIGICYLLMFFI